MVELVAVRAGNGGTTEVTDPLAVRADVDGGSDENRLGAHVADQGALRTDAVQKMGWHWQGQDIGKRGSLSPERAC
jgi:hypothetical protein